MAMEPRQKRGRGRPKSLFHEPQTGTVQALDRGLTLMKELARSRGLTLTDLSGRLDMAPSSAHRILSTLQKQGFADLDDISQEWSVGIEAFRVGSAFLVRTNLVEASIRQMRRLMEETGETANLAIADGGDVVFISQVETHNPIRAFYRPGSRSPMHSSGIGKALLANAPRAEVERLVHRTGLVRHTERTCATPEALFADLDEIRRRGWSLDNEERYDGMRCVAATIFNAYGEAVAGISVSGPTVRFPDEALDGIGDKVCRAADEVTRLIGGTPPAG
ncbi:MAG: IclR family transcriptional regulator [Rhizobiaceae bacterium]